jgi:hypothetical protein
MPRETLYEAVVTRTDGEAVTIPAWASGGATASDVAAEVIRQGEIKPGQTVTVTRRGEILGVWLLTHGGRIVQAQISGGYVIQPGEPHYLH